MCELHTTPSRPILEVKDLKTHAFLDAGVLRAVNGVSFSLDHKKTIGLVGESGCGKSMVAMSIMRLLKWPPLKIVSGSITLTRKDNSSVDIAQLHPNSSDMRHIRGGEIAMIFQEPMTSLNPLYTVGNQIAESIMLHQKVKKKEALDRALDIVTRVHISEPKRRLNSYPHQLSGGMRQRVMIALALSCNPSILIADEPTTALDVTVQAQILDLMHELQETFGSSIIMISHNLAVISQVTDTVAVMYVGRIVEQAPVKELFHHPLHPYTVGLMESVPVFGRKGKRLEPIPGMVPTPLAEIHGCAFAPRCPRVMERCKSERPELRETRPGHCVACWLY